MGVSYNEKEQSFVFDYGHDVIEDIVSLTGNGYQIEAFGKCFYYGYEFADHVTGITRGQFIKFNEDNQITIFSIIGRKNLMADSY